MPSARPVLAALLAPILASAGPARGDTGDTGWVGPWIQGPDGCEERETVTVHVDPPPGGTCEWAFDEEIQPGEGTAGATSVEVTCPECAGEGGTETYSMYVVCTDARGSARWGFDDLVVTCGEGEMSPIGGCECGTRGRPSGWAAGSGVAGTLLWLWTRRRARGLRTG